MLRLRATRTIRSGQLISLQIDFDSRWVLHSHCKIMNFMRPIVFWVQMAHRWLQSEALIPRNLNWMVMSAALDPSMRAKLAEVHLINAVGSTPAELATFLSQEIETYSTIVRVANIKAE
jgi:hypothetical protein